MTVPEKIKIQWIDDYHTETIGRAAGDRQFMGFVLQARLNDVPVTRKDPFQVYAVLYTFDLDGNLLTTEHRCAGMRQGSPMEEAQLFDRAGTNLDEMLSRLGKLEFCDVEIRLFSVTIDGILFGLVDGSYEDGGKIYERIELTPNDIVFNPPYDGSYDT